MEAWKEININKKEEKGLIKWQLIITFKTVIEELKKANKEVNSTVQLDDNRHVLNM